MSTIEDGSSNNNNTTTSVSISSGTDDYEKKPTTSKKSTPSFTMVNAESIRVYVSSFFIRIRQRVTMESLRPLTMFLGITGPNILCFSAEAFTPPITAHNFNNSNQTLIYDKIKSRLKLNFTYFLTNYALLTLGVSIVVSLLHPGMIISCSIVWSLWTLHEYLIHNKLIIMNKYNIGTLVSISKRSIILSVVTILVIIWKCLYPFITVILTSSFLIFIHALMRDPKHVDACTNINNTYTTTSSNTGSTYKDYNINPSSTSSNHHYDDGSDSEQSYDMTNTESDDDRVIVERGDVI